MAAQLRGKSNRLKIYVSAFRNCPQSPIWPVSQAVKIPPFHGGDRSSTLLLATSRLNGICARSSTVEQSVYTRYQCQISARLQVRILSGVPHLILGSSASHLRFIWAGRAAASTQNCKFCTLDTSKVRVLPCSPSIGSNSNSNQLCTLYSKWTLQKESAQFLSRGKLAVNGKIWDFVMSVQLAPFRPQELSPLSCMKAKTE